ncbi:MAG: hypothetical protein ACP5OO_03700 [Chloroflexia bacterium]
MTEGQQAPSGGAPPTGAEEQARRIIEAARLLGVSVDETDVAQWLTALAAGQSPGQDWQVDTRAGIFGHRLTLLDFDPASLERYRRIADIVQFPDRPNVETAIALSGSAAQGRIQPYPADYDFFERVNILAPTRQEACRILGEIMREKALEHLSSPQIQLVEVKFGTWQDDVVKAGRRLSRGEPISWTAEEVQAGRMEVFSPAGEKMTIPWEYGCREPGWCKLDWVIALPEEGRVVNASNMLDVTWENPEGEIVPLDGFLDPYFQEVYLEAASIPLFAKLAGRMPPQVVSEYVRQLEEQVRKYALHDPRNFGKVAKRLYNIFRLIGRYQEAAWIRALFDEPTSQLYQVMALLETLDEVRKEAATLDREALVGQVDRLIRQVVETLEGPQETELVMALLRLRDDLSGRRALGEEWDAVMERSRSEVAALVNRFFEEKLMAIPEVRAYIEGLEQG